MLSDFVQDPDELSRLIDHRRQAQAKYSAAEDEKRDVPKPELSESRATTSKDSVADEIREQSSSSLIEDASVIFQENPKEVFPGDVNSVRRRVGTNTEKRKKGNAKYADFEKEADRIGNVFCMCS